MLVGKAYIQGIIYIYIYIQIGEELIKVTHCKKKEDEIFIKGDEIEYEKLSIMYYGPLFNDSNLKLSHQLHCVKLNNISNIKGHLTFDDNICGKKKGNIFNVFVN